MINRYSLNDRSHLFIHPAPHLHGSQHLLRSLQCLLKGGKGRGKSKEWKMKMEKNGGEKNREGEDFREEKQKDCVANG